MAQHQINQILERAIDTLPEPFRVVLVARLVEEISIEETADLLGLRPETVKTRCIAPGFCCATISNGRSGRC